MQGEPRQGSLVHSFIQCILMSEVMVTRLYSEDKMNKARLWSLKSSVPGMERDDKMTRTTVV